MFQLNTSVAWMQQVQLVNLNCQHATFHSTAELPKKLQFFSAITSETKLYMYHTVGLKKNVRLPTQALKARTIVFGQVENAEVRKPKYGSENKSRLLMSSALLTHGKAL